MGAGIYIELHRKNEDPAHAAKIAACNALDAAGESVLPPSLAEYFGCEFVRTALSRAAEPVRTIDMVYERGDEPGLTWLRRPDRQCESVVGIDLDKLPDDLRILRVRWG